MQSRTILLATYNPGKLREISNIAKEYGLIITSPADLGLSVKVIEDGKTFEENASKKVKVFADAIHDPEVLIIGDDSGIEIPALGNQPGVFTRRWSGKEMTDQEIIDYCLEKMKKFSDNDRRAVFRTVLALGKYGEDKMKFFEGSLLGKILNKADERPVIPGLPFGVIFYVTESDMLLLDMHGKSLGERKDYKTHREKAFHNLFQCLRGYTHDPE